MNPSRDLSEPTFERARYLADVSHLAGLLSARAAVIRAGSEPARDFAEDAAAVLVRHLRYKRADARRAVADALTLGRPRDLQDLLARVFSKRP